MMNADDSSDLNHSGGQHSLSFAYETHLRQDLNEQTHWNDVCRAYRQYSAFVIQQYGLNFPHRLASFPASQRALLPLYLQHGTSEFQQRLTLFKDAAIRNQFCLDCILRHAGQPISQGAVNDQDYATESQISKVASVLKSLARDWSVEGAEERNMAYAPILESVQKYCPRSAVGGPRSSRPKICVPGAGVGRLALELAALGYTVQGNEFSLYMLLASDFILNGPVVSVSSSMSDRDENGSPRRHPLSISPWLLETRNVHTMADPFRTVQIPDVDPYDMITKTFSEKSVEVPGRNGHAVTSEGVTLSRDAVRDKSDDVDFSMAAGDFSSIYSASSELGAWDIVVACFFLDASPNVIEYLQVVYNMLKAGGILISFGPLHWHWSGPSMQLSDQSFTEYLARFDHLDPKYLHSYDFCWDDIKTILINIGFEIVEQKFGVPALYTADLSSMLVSEYRCVHFVARKTVPSS